MKGLLLLALISVFPTGSDGHARLVDPPGRSAAWRSGFNTPVNVNDNQLNCGGAGNQWGSQGGKCGMCGDPYQVARPRPNEHGGKYGIGVITKTYKQGQWIDIGLDVTANHRGWHEIRVCSLDNGSETEECFDENLLELENGQTRWILPGGINKVFTYKVKLPDHLACSHCTLQWKWHCGNNWGVDKETGKGCTGCGPQEEFWSCADIMIEPTNGEIPVTKPTTTTPKPTTTTPRPTTTTPRPTTRPTTTTPRPTTRPTTTTPRPTTRPTTTTPRPTTRPTTTTPRPTTRPTTTTPRPTTRPTTTTPRPTPRPTNRPTTMRPATPPPEVTQPPTRRPSGSKECRSTGLYARLPNKSNYDYYCRTNCAAGYCPPSVCTCD